MIQKVLAYITRTYLGRVELLTFTHRDYPNAGIQVPAGTVESGEELESALLREIKEESGLAQVTIIKKLGREIYFHPDKKEEQERHFYEVYLNGDAPTTWEYTVQSGSEDKNLVFVYTWIPITERLQLAGNQGIFLDCITTTAIPYAQST